MSPVRSLVLHLVIYLVGVPLMCAGMYGFYWLMPRLFGLGLGLVLIAAPLSFVLTVALAWVFVCLAFQLSRPVTRRRADRLTSDTNDVQ